MTKLTMRDLETLPYSVVGNTIPPDMLRERVGELIPDNVFSELEYVETPVPQTGAFSCVSCMRTPSGRDIMVLEDNSGTKRLSWW